MINIKKLENTNIYEFKINGKIDEKGMENLYELMETAVADNQKINLLGAIHEMPGFEDFDAFTETVKMKFKAIGGIEKYAIITKQDWIENILPVANFVSPNIPIKYFEDRSKAVKWLEKEEVETIDPEDYFTNMNIEQIRGTDIFSFTVDGEVDYAGMKTIHQILSERATDEKIKLLAVLRDFDGFEDFKTFVESIKADFAGLFKVKKYAILSNNEWVERIVKVENFILPLPIKVFGLEEKEATVAWLKV